MGEYRISIIVPVYNAQNHIKKCVDSIIRQITDIDEILLINDGSKDNSEAILREYEKKYSNIRVISKDNEGVAKTRNLGIQEAKGKYICFIDNDDFIDQNYFENFMNVAEDGYDIVIGGYRRVEAEKIRFEVTPTDTAWYKYIITAPWAKIYRRQFLIDNDIKFLNYGLGEDIYFSIVAYSCTNKIKTINYIGYNWYFNEESVSNTSQRGFNATLDPVYLLERIYQRVGTENEEYSYFYVRYGIWYLLFSGRNAQYNDFIREYYNIFSWYRKNDIKEKFPILSSKTKGEKASVKLVIKSFLLIHKVKCVKLFARFYCKG